MPLPARPYPYALDEPLLWLTKTNPWTIQDSSEGVQILGDVGSGKTSGSGRTLARAYLKAGYGGLVLCKKIDEAHTWIQYAKDTGRQDQLLIIHPRQPWRFNFLQYTFERSGEGAGFVQNAVELFMSVIQNRRDVANQAAQEQRFFIDGSRRLIRNGMETLLLAGEPVTIDGLMRLFSSTPFPHPQTGTAVWPKPPASDEFLARTLAKATYRHRHGLTIDAPTEAHPDDLRAFFLREFARPGSNRQSAGILSTFTGMVEPFLSGPIKELFCTTTNFHPAEFSRKGAIIILDLPLDEYEEIGRTAALTLKYIWQRGLVRRQGVPPGEVPVFLWADEAQNFTTPADPKFLNECRSSICSTVYLTQNINNYIASFHQNAEAQANALLAGMNTKIAHRNGDHKTNEWMAETIARGREILYSGGENDSINISHSTSDGTNQNSSTSPSGPTSGGGSNQGRSTSVSRQRGTNNAWAEHMEFQVQPALFTRLKNGGSQNNYAVEAILFKSGSAFETTGRPFTGVAFDQRS